MPTSLSTWSASTTKAWGWAWGWAWATMEWAWGWAWALMTATSQQPALTAYLRQPERTTTRAGKTALPIVFCGGANLILIQWVLVREMTTLLLGTELVVLLVSLSY